VIAFVVKLAPPADEIVFADALNGNCGEVVMVHHPAASDVRDRDDIGFNGEQDNNVKVVRQLMRHAKLSTTMEI
jgi:hypothetical protein